MPADIPRYARTRRFPHVLTMRERVALNARLLTRRLDELLPRLMRESCLDVWLVLCREDNLDPVLPSLLPMATRTPILQIYAFVDRGEAGLQRVEIAMTGAGDWYERPWSGREEAEQWDALRDLLLERDPRRIGINVAPVQWACDGLSHTLYERLLECLPEGFASRLESAEGLAARWLSVLTEEELELYEHVATVAHALIGEAYTRRIVPGVTTIEDLAYAYWERANSFGFHVRSLPPFQLVRSPANRERYGAEDRTIREGDFVSCDLVIGYMGLYTDHKQWAYVLRPGEEAAPAGMRALMREARRLQDIWLAEVRPGITGDEALSRILDRAREEGIPEPKVYSHAIGMFVHEPGPLIGLPWEQERCPGRGDSTIEVGQTFSMELSVRGPVPEWGGQERTFPLEENVAVTESGTRVLDGRQDEFYLI